MASSPIRIGGVAPGSVAGAAEFQAFLRGYPQQVIEDIRAELQTGADSMVSAIKERAPVSELEAHPGELRESVHKEDGRHDLSIVVVEDAGESEGRGYSRFVEFGHKSKDGKHVAEVPHFWPAVREERKKIIAAMRAGMRRRAKGDT